MDDGCAFLSREEIALHCERIARGKLAIGPETAAQTIPIVFPGTAALSGQGTEVEIVRENAVVYFFLNGPPILHQALRLSLRASGGTDQSARRIRSPLGHNVNHSVNSVSPPDRRARPANYFDPVDVFQRHVLGVPVHPA